MFNSSLATFAAEEPETQAVETESETSLETELSDDEIVTAEDITIQAGEKFDIESDFTGLTISPEKVKVPLKRLPVQKNRRLTIIRRIPTQPYIMSNHIAEDRLMKSHGKLS